MYNPDIHKRQSIRLRNFDYAGAGAYFVTMCAWQRECLFGDVVDGEIRLNEFGVVVRDCWIAVPKHFPHVELDESVIMPNHFHGVFWIVDGYSPVGAQHAAPLPTSPRGVTPNNVRPGSVAAIIRSFKSAATKHINTLRDNPGCPVWQRNFYEHVIRGERDLHAVRQYITENPTKWELDTNHPTRI